MLALSSFFQDGLKVVENLKPTMEKLCTDLAGVSLGFSWSWCHIITPLFCLIQCFIWVILSVNKVKQVQEGEKKQLIQLRDILKSSLQSEQKEVRFIISWRMNNVQYVCFAVSSIKHNYFVINFLGVFLLKIPVLKTHQKYCFSYLNVCQYLLLEDSRLVLRHFFALVMDFLPFVVRGLSLSCALVFHKYGLSFNWEYKNIYFSFEKRLRGDYLRLLENANLLLAQCTD